MIKKISLLSLISLAIFAYLVVYAATSYRSDPNSTITVNEQGTCKTVTNSGGSGRSYFIPVNTSNEWNLFRQNKPSDVSLGECYLVNNNHTEADCTNLGGSVVDIGGGNKICKLSGGSCPGGWTQYNSWSETANKYCTGRSIHFMCKSDASCNTGSHGFSNTSQEICKYYNYSFYSPPTICYSRQCISYPCGVSCSWRRGCRVNWCSGCVNVPYPCGIASCQYGNGVECYADTTSVGCY